jgi:hypothetical protein
MRLLADENIDAEWIRALADDGHDIVRAVDAAPLEIGDLDPAVLAAATALNRVLLTADRSDFADPPRDDHAGIIIVASITRSGGGSTVLKTPATISPERSRLSATGCSAAVASVRLLLFSNTIVLNTETTQPEARAGLPIRLPATH